MPKVAASARQRRERFVKEFGKEHFTTDGNVLTCKVCEQPVNDKKKYLVEQHIKSERHQSRARAKAGRTEDVCLLANFIELSNKESAFNMDLCQMFVECNIPLFVANHASFRSFLEKWSKQQVPDQSTLRNRYLKKLYDATILKIRAAVGDNPIWVSADETTDAKGQYVVNTVIGAMTAEKPSTSYLIGSEVVARTNHTTVAQAFMNSLGLLWPEGIQHDKVLLFISDAAPYMRKTGEALKVLFPKLTHVTCLAHAIHRVCEEIRVSFPDVDGLVANVKKVFLKCPSRKRVFQDTVPNLALPPSPTITRWGTWMTAALYYANNFEEVGEVLSKLDENEAAAIKRSKELMLEPTLKNNLAYIASNFSSLPASIEKLECTTQPLNSVLRILREVEQGINNAEGAIGEGIRDKFHRIMRRNPGLDTLIQIQKILQGDATTTNFSELSATDVASFKYAPLVSVDVERSFSRYKLLLSDRRYRLTPENTMLHIIPMCNASLFDKPIDDDDDE